MPPEEQLAWNSGRITVANDVAPLVAGWQALPPDEPVDPLPVEPVDPLDVPELPEPEFEPELPPPPPEQAPAPATAAITMSTREDFVRAMASGTVLSSDELSRSRLNGRFKRRMRHDPDKTCCAPASQQESFHRNVETTSVYSGQARRSTRTRAKTRSRRDNSIAAARKKTACQALLPRKPTGRSDSFNFD